MLTLRDIEKAQERICDAIYHSPCPYSFHLSRLCGAEIYCKFDHLQMTGNFKERGARNRLLLLSPQQRLQGVIAASAGNHALGLSYHGQLLTIPVTVVMPKWAPLVKLQNCRRFNANVILHGESYDDARKYAIELARERSLEYVPGFDDEAIMAGAGTIGLEILEDVPDVDAVIVPVGGGGLIAGIATAIKAKKPSVKVIGVEPAHAPTLTESLKRGCVTHVAIKPTLADGLAVAEIGTLCFQVARRLVDEVVLVSEEEIARAIARLLEYEKTVTEGAGAVSLAAMVGKKTPALDGKKVVLLLSGGNIDVTMISRIIERGLAADGRLARVTIQLSDRPGKLAQLLAILAECGASIKEVQHDRNFGPLDVAVVNVSVIMETRDKQHIEEINAALKNAGLIA